MTRILVLFCLLLLGLSAQAEDIPFDEQRNEKRGVRIPMLEGSKLSSAEKVLRSRRIPYKIQRVNASLEADVVLQTRPPSGQRLKPKEKVVLIVSLGPKQASTSPHSTTLEPVRPPGTGHLLIFLIGQFVLAGFWLLATHRLELEEERVTFLRIVTRLVPKKGDMD